jgi:hypothetical protein
MLRKHWWREGLMRQQTALDRSVTQACLFKMGDTYSLALILTNLLSELPMLLPIGHPV